MKTSNIIIMAASVLTIFLIVPAFGGSAAFKDNIYDPGKLKPIDSRWVICGFRSYRIFGPMVRSPINTAFCVPMAFPKERFFSSIKKASSGISG